MDRALVDSVRNSPHRILATTSGNAQPYIGHERGLKKDSPQAVTDYHYPVPKNTLGSNDHRVILKRKINSRKLKRRMALAQRYLQHPKYLKYVSRPRKDPDKNGDLIWSDDVETAFHNAIINLPAIGKKKKAQHGRPHGHNELIGEWILQETGKSRERKQVSSHLQVFQNMFKDIVPEWAILTRESDDTEMDHEEGHEYYHNSIEEMVRDWKKMQGDPSHVDATQSSFLHMAHSLAWLDFEMWVSLPDSMNQPLHRYTRIQSNQPTSIPEPLENVKSWRTDWPGLASMIEGLPHGEQPEIAVVDTTFELMKDFPPRKSKLGINLALNFTNPALSDHVSNDSHSWGCASYFYHMGRLESKAVHDDCQTFGQGKVRLPFESKWWAKKFTEFTEKRRRAQDSKNEAAVAAAEETARKYLRNLTVLQRVSAKPIHSQPGTTTWRRLILPPARTAVNSPPPPSLEMALPALDMDSTVNMTIHDDLFSFNHTLPSQILQSEVYDDKLLDGIEQKRSSQQNQLQNIQDHYRTFPHADHISANSQGMFDAHFNPHQPHEYVSEYPGHFSEHGEHLYSNNVFEMQEHLQYAQMSHGECHGNHNHEESETNLDTETHPHRRPLMTFDMNTHNLLQQQLSSSHQQRDRLDHEQPQQVTPYEQISTHSDSLSGIIGAAPRTEMCLQGEGSIQPQTAVHKVDSAQNMQLPLNASPLSLAQATTRPALQHHHSFTGVLHHNIYTDPIMENNSRPNFGLLLDGFATNRDEVSVGGTPSIMPNPFDGLGAARAHSQPPLSATLDKELIKHETTAHAPQALPDGGLALVEIT